MDKSTVLCVVCGKPIGENGTIYYNPDGTLGGLCENNHDALLPILLHTPIDEVHLSDGHPCGGGGPKPQG